MARNCTSRGNSHVIWTAPASQFSAETPGTPWKPLGNPSEVHAETPRKPLASPSRTGRQTPSHTARLRKTNKRLAVKEERERERGQEIGDRRWEMDRRRLRGIQTLRDSERSRVVKGSAAVPPRARSEQTRSKPTSFHLVPNISSQPEEDRPRQKEGALSAETERRAHM